MLDPHEFLKALTIVLCTAGVTTVLFHRLRQPVVLGYILAGLIVGPNIPIPLAADRQIVQTLSELGVILLMFALGLEVSLRKLLRLGPTAGVAAVVQSSLMVWLGYLIGQAFGWTSLESLFAGAIIAISSTTIIAKAFDEQGIKGKLRELVVGILIVEDLIAILLMAFLTAISSGDGLTPDALFRSVGRLGAFLVGLIAVGLLVVPRLIRAIGRLNSPETTVVVSIGVCFATALLAHELGYSVALGAFLAGSLVAESGEEKRIEHLVLPIRDMFAAIFFVSVGMLIDPALILEHWAAVLAFTAIVIAGKVLGVSLGTFLAGNGTRTSVRAGMSLAQIGEFSFIIASLGIALGATRDFLYPVAVAVSGLTTLTTPWLIRLSGRAASAVDRVLPGPVQTFAALYGTWIERLRRAPRLATRRAAVRRLAWRLALDAAILASILIGLAFELDPLAAWMTEAAQISSPAAKALVVTVALALVSPFAIGIFRISRRLGLLLAEAALPVAADGTLDLAAAPRRSLVVTLQLGLVLAAVIPVLLVSQPFLPRLVLGLAVLLLLGGLGVAFWRSAASLHGHVKASAELIVEVLANQSNSGSPPAENPLEQASEILPGIGQPVTIALDESSIAVGKTLAELDLRGRTGATVLAITHGQESVMIPTAREVLRAGDLLAVAGTDDSISAAAALLRGEDPDAS